MTEIYLSRVRIQDFRTFGTFDIEIPAAPGLTIISGTNGLGKSNFFDAVEWGLTGNVRRFERYIAKKKFLEGDYLTRAGAAPGSHMVKLSFTDHIEFERSHGFSTPQSEIIAGLAKRGKTTIQDLETYLALTHFLGQASDQRFTSRDEKDQWKALRGPSGIDRIESVRGSIKHRSITMAFNNRIRDEQAAILNVEQRMAQWEGWQFRLARLKQSMRFAGTLTSEEVLQSIRALELELAIIVKDSGGIIEGEAPIQRLARLSKLIAIALARVQERMAVLEDLSSLVDSFATAALNADPEHPVLIRARRDLESARAVAAAVALRVDTSVANIEAQNSAIRKLEQEIGLLESARLDLSRQQDVATQIKSAESEQARIAEDVAARRSAVLGVESELQSYSDAVGVVASLRSNAERARLLVVSHDKLLELDAVVARDANALTAAKQAAADAQPELDSAVEDREVLTEAINNATIAYADLERQASAISGAVATIASHIAHSDTECPVCSSTFEAGALKLLADTAARSGNDNLARIAAEIAGMRSELSGLNMRIEALSQVVSRPGKLLPNLNAIRDAATRARVALSDELSLDLSADLNLAVCEREERTFNELKLAVTKQEELATSAASASERRRALLDEIGSQVAQQAQLTASLSLLCAEERACSERIGARGMTSLSIDAINARMVEQRNALEAARAHTLPLIEELSNSRSALSSAYQLLSVAERDVADAQSARSSAQEHLAHLELRWTHAVLDGKPNRDSLNSALSAVQAEAVQLRNKASHIDDLAKSNQDLQLTEEIEELIATMKNSGGEDSIGQPEKYVERLRKELSAAKAAAQITIEAQRAVNSFGGTLKSNVEEYSAQVLAPLNDIIVEFNEAMLSSPGQSIQFTTKHNISSTTFGMALQNRAQLQSGATPQEAVPPQLMLSEGQIAANGFSILCAASTAYQWSRWRALLLDDPLQHNDIIHTSAFIDVMRNMVELNGYQLIISTHDKGESDFIERKFGAAGLPCTRISLTGPSENGVLFDGPFYNDAASAIMKGPGNVALSLS